ncbi:DNA polymerase III subunit delta' [Leptolyngbya sp. GGD]|uniref:DNA polymerase III subunit delta' n=1 Tax=Leptolyngbya sp. GGD TaxID=2997907 RepID=UPI00227CC1E5|nr:DNA polymerase III subunit delta' [Leptolyngbya sp. GGD]MCY6493960.1 DNA polymerase III subunit delta' [Leptolyngbya sp. GGD]
MSVVKPPIGQSSAITQLQAAITQNRLAPAYLFTGFDGVGRKLAAQWLSQQLLCHQDATHPDILWIEPTFTKDGHQYTHSEAERNGLTAKSRSQIRIDQIRQIITLLQQPPLLASRSLVVIDGAETMTEAAANTLLKILEEPGRATLILITPTSNHLLPTIRSRCQTIHFKRLPFELLTQVVQGPCPELLKHPDLIRFAQGSPGRAIAAWKNAQQIPTTIIHMLNRSDRPIWDCLSLSQQIQALDFSLQLWLLNFLQFQSWQQSRCSKIFHQFEKTRTYLSQHCQAQMVWDWLLTSLPKTQWQLPAIMQSPCQHLSSQMASLPESEVATKSVSVVQQPTAEPSTEFGGRQTDLFEAIVLNKQSPNPSIDYGNSSSSFVQSH